MSRLRHLLVLATTALVLSAPTAAAAAAANGKANLIASPATTTSNYPLVSWTVAQGTTPNLVRISTAAAVDANGMLVRRFATLLPYDVDTEDPSADIAYWHSTAPWRTDSPDKPLFPGSYWVQLQTDGIDDNFNVVHAWSAPAKVVVKKYGSSPKATLEDDPSGDSYDLIYRVKMHTNARLVPMRVLVTIGGARVCSSDAPLRFVEGSLGVAEREVSCRIPPRIITPQWKKLSYTTTVVAGNIASTGKQWRIARSGHLGD